MSKSKIHTTSFASQENSKAILDFKPLMLNILITWSYFDDKNQGCKLLFVQYITPPFASSSVITTICTSSLTSSVHLHFGLPLFLQPDGACFNILCPTSTYPPLLVLLTWYHIYSVCFLTKIRTLSIFILLRFLWHMLRFCSDVLIVTYMQWGVYLKWTQFKQHRRCLSLYSAHE